MQRLHIMMTVQDSITREITLKAPMERVYEAISRPDGIVSWFAHGVEGETSVGSQPVFDQGEYGKLRVAVVAAEPFHHFAYRWVSKPGMGPEGFLDNPLDHPNTLVEFFLEPTEEGTRLKLVESGFASLPAEYREKNAKNNSGGWEHMLGNLEKYMATGIPI